MHSTPRHPDIAEDRGSVSLPPMKTILTSAAPLILAALCNGCVVRETVTRNGEVISDGLKVEKPLHRHTDDNSDAAR